MDNPNDPHAGPASTSSVVDRYQRQCQSGAMPDLAAFVASLPALAPRDLAALVHVDQRHRQAAGAPSPAESYFEQFPLLRSDTELALDVVYQEYVLRRDAGEAYATDKYLARFPDLAERLAMQFDLDGAMGDEHSSRSMPAAQVTAEQTPANPPGTVIAGSYKLLEQIGEGGMGAVWVAQQTEPVRRRVALKLIKPGMDSRQVLARFEAERQALAVMDHPHIAKVLDGGVTDQGRPYFVMEYVKGEPITDYCDRARLSVQERLKLFVQVCQAVQHAHQKGIIHRDLKPSNILVCPYDGQPVPKVIDFGLAKAMHQPLTEHSLYTGHGVMVGTPLYMSPEQAETNNLDIDTRADLYSLGVILYELLTGSTPLEKRRFQDAALQEMLRLIKEEEPPKPSTRLSGSGSLPTIAAQRSLEPAQLSRAVRGDLDWIVMKSLEKERSRRYETANGLARDIERYLHDDPVEARPPSAGYRFSKFARRNKAALLTVGLVAAALVVGTMVSTWQAIRATRAERVAQDERVEAEYQRAAAAANYQKAKAAVDKYFTLVSESTLFDVPGLESLRKDLLEAALEFYEGAALERTSDPDVLVDLASMHLRVHLIYHSLNRVDEGIAAIDRTLDVVERLRREHPNGRDHERHLAGFWKGMRWTRGAMESPHDLAGALQTMLQLEKTWTQLAEKYPSDAAFQMDLAYIQAMIGTHLRDSGRKKEAAAYRDKSHALMERLISQYPTVVQYRADLADSTGSHAGTLIEAGRAAAALPILRRGVDLSEGLVSEFPTICAYRASLAGNHKGLATLLAQTQPQQAQKSNGRVMELAESLVREFPGHLPYLEIWASTAVDWAAFETALGNHSQVENVIRKVIEALETQFKARPNDRRFRQVVAWALPNTADKLQANLAVRDLLLRQALALHTELAQEAPGEPAHFEQVGHLHRKLGWLARDEAQLDEARQCFAKASDTFEKLATDKIPQRDGFYRACQADSLWDLAQILAAGDAKQAAAVARRSVDVCRTLVNDYAGNLQYRQKLTAGLRILAERLAAIGRHDEAEAARQEIIEVWEAHLARNPKDRQAQDQLSWSLSEAADKLQTNPDVREPILRKALALHAALADEAPDEPAHYEQVGHLHRHLGWLARDKGQLDEAHKDFEKAAQIFEKLAADKIPQRDGFYRAFRADSLWQLAQLLAAGDANESAAVAQQSVDLYQSLVSEYPANVDFQKKTNWGAMFLAQRLIATGQLQQAVEASRRYVAFCEKLQRDHPQEDLKPQSASAYLALCSSLTATSQVDEAQQAWEKAVEMGLSDANALNEFAWNLVAPRDVEPALAVLAVQTAEKGTKVAPNNAMYLNTLGVAQYRAGKWAEANGSLAKVEELAPDKYLAFNGFFLAMAHWQLDHKDEARKWYDRSVEWMEKNQPKNEELIRFRAEAVQLLGIAQPGPAPKPSPAAKNPPQVEDTAKPKS